MIMQFDKAGEFIISKLKNELPAYLCYHNLEHTLDVYKVAAYLGHEEGLTDYEMKLLLTAAWYHDAGFINGAAGHEYGSCEIARAALPGFGYNSEEINCICGIITATRLPQSPQNHLEQIIADADLDYLGRNDFYSTGQRLFEELTATGAALTREAWHRRQIDFLDNHQYFTATAIRTRNGLKCLHLAELKKQPAFEAGCESLSKSKGYK